MHKISAKKSTLILLVVAIVLGIAMCDSGPKQMQRIVQHFNKLENERQKSVRSDVSSSTLRPSEQYHIADAVWCGDNKTLVTSGGTDASVLVWDAQRGEMLKTLDRASGTRAIACSNDSRFVASGNSVNNPRAAVRVWDIEKSFEASDIAAPVSAIEEKRDRIAKYLVFNTDNTRLYVHYLNLKREHHLVAYEIPTWKAVSDLTLSGRLETNPILSARGDVYAYGFGSQDITVIDPASGAEKLRFRTDKLRVRVLAFGRDNMSIFIGGQRLYGGPHQGMPEHVVEEYSLQDGKLLRTIVTGHLYELNAMSFRQDPDLLITASGDKTVELRNPADGALINTFGDKTNQIHSIAVRPDGKHLATAGGVVNLWLIQ